MFYFIHIESMVCGSIPALISRTHLCHEDMTYFSGEGCNMGNKIIFTIYLNVLHTFYYMAGNCTSLHTQVMS